MTSMRQIASGDAGCPIGKRDTAVQDLEEDRRLAVILSVHVRIDRYSSVSDLDDIFHVLNLFHWDRILRYLPAPFHLFYPELLILAFLYWE